jgi:hypothetical protein
MNMLRRALPLMTGLKALLAGSCNKDGGVVVIASNLTGVGARWLSEPEIGQKSAAQRHPRLEALDD